MEYSNEFKDLIARIEQTKDFIGYGNPNAKILIIGKEEALDIEKECGKEIYEIAVKPNWEKWKELKDDSSITPDSIPIWKETRFFSPLYPWKGDTLPTGGNNTWRNYQKLINMLIPEANKGNITTFHQYAFITEFNDLPSPKSKHKDPNVQKSINDRCEKVLNHPFYKSFPIVIAACGHYVKDYNIKLEELFDQKFIEMKPVDKGEWINFHQKDNRILIHTRQLSWCSKELIERIAEYCMITMRQELIKILQTNANKFITENKLDLNGLIIEPKEIEVYYYKDGVFEDNSVHRNELQAANSNHFYIHRMGIKRTDTYKGGNYPGIDYVVSDEKDIYYSYLIRSAVVNGKLVIGPNKVLKTILHQSNMSEAQLEATDIKIIKCDKICDVMYSSRINLGKAVTEEFVGYKLRLVLCDELYLQSKYPRKENMLVEYLYDKVQNHMISKDDALRFAKEKLGYIPCVIKEL